MQNRLQDSAGNAIACEQVATNIPTRQRSTTLTVESIAEVCHETNRAYCSVTGDDSQPPWYGAPEWQRDSAIKGVKFHLANPNAKPEDSHNNWLEQKVAEGWTYGPVKNPEKKEHPCLVPYNGLPMAQQVKDALFIGVVRALEGALPKATESSKESSQPSPDSGVQQEQGEASKIPGANAPTVPETQSPSRTGQTE